LNKVAAYWGEYLRVKKIGQPGDGAHLKFRECLQDFERSCEGLGKSGSFCPRARLFQAPWAFVSCWLRNIRNQICVGSVNSFV
jgi:hypothetical protein